MRLAQAAVAAACCCGAAASSAPPPLVRLGAPRPRRRDEAATSQPSAAPTAIPYITILTPADGELISRHAPCIALVEVPVPNGTNFSIPDVFASCSSWALPPGQPQERATAEVTCPDTTGQTAVMCKGVFGKSEFSRCTDEHLILTAVDFQAPPGQRRAVITLRVSGDTTAWIYVGVSAVSLLLCLAVLFQAARSRALRRWPGELALSRTLSHLLLACTLLGQNLWLLTRHSTACHAFVVWVTQFALFSAIGWYFILSLDFYQSVSQPFSRTQSRAPVYHALVWLAAGGTATGVSARGGFYRSDFELCWISRDDSSVSYPDWVYLWGWLGLSLLASWFMIVSALLKMRQISLRRTLTSRREGLKRMQVWTIAFAVHWGLLSILWFAGWVLERDSEHFWATSGRSNVMVQNRGIAEAFAVSLSALGLVDALSWAVTQHRRMRVVAFQRDGAGAVSLRPEPNSDVEPTFDILDGTVLVVLADLGEWMRVGLSLAEGEYLEGYVKARNVVPLGQFSGEVADHHSQAKSDRDGPSPSPAFSAAGNANESSTHLDQKLYEPPDDDSIRPYDDLSDALRIEFIWAIAAGIKATAAKQSSAPPSHSRASWAADAQHKLQTALVATADCFRGEEVSETVDGDSFGPPAQATHIFTCYAPKLFEALRRHWGVMFREFLHSVDKEPEHGLRERDFSEGQSGEFMFFSADRHYLFKTVSKREHDTLLDMLPAYCAHMLDTTESLLCRFMGLYAIKMYGQVQYVVVMRNVLSIHPAESLSAVYDLKGSRRGCGTGHRSRGAARQRHTLKDDDLHQPLRLTPGSARQVQSAVRRDTMFLRDHNIMDYSLLVGVVDVSVPAPRLDVDRAGQYSASVVVGPGRYYIGIIDILQRWTLWKQLDRAYKLVFKGYWRTLPLQLRRRAHRRALLDHPNISTVTPPYYARRFCWMLRSAVVTETGAEARVRALESVIREAGGHTVGSFPGDQGTPGLERPYPGVGPFQRVDTDVGTLNSIPSHSA
eukprot:TRINITY_DN50641_c0_g1_i1.p1 TRINITY_DN50641_c0_g1~~TRINITY_DN50641_c0_g1_i1.p1  ORF type:complete len:1032 (+),score=268.71 TRINITY_DN50641_c0_g1_i1:83-3097(+)